MIVIATGGTYGHFFPAKTLCESLKRRQRDSLVMGVFDKDPRLCRAEGLEIIPVAGSPSKLKGCISILKGVHQAYKELQRRGATHVVCFGGYGAFPVVAAARLLKIPYSICELDCYPSLVNRLFAKQAHHRFRYFESRESHLKGLIRYVKPLFHKPVELYSQRDHILISGGSQGALSLNRQVKALLPRLKTVFQGFHVVHTVGWKEDMGAIRRAYQEAEIEATVEPFIENMPYARSAFAISRAGSGAIHELSRHEVPALLIPHINPATHQHDMALFFAEQMKGGLFIDAGASSDRLYASIITLSSNLEKYREGLRNYEAAIAKRPSHEEALLEVFS